MKGQKQFFIINLSVCKLKLYAREGAALTARRKRKGKKASKKKKLTPIKSTLNSKQTKQNYNNKRRKKKETERKKERKKRQEKVRNLQVNSPTLKSIAHKSLVRPILEYSSVWSPYTKLNIDN